MHLRVKFTLLLDLLWVALKTETILLNLLLCVSLKATSSFLISGGKICMKKLVWLKNENWMVPIFASTFPKEKKTYIDNEIPKINSRAINRLDYLWSIYILIS